MERVVSRVLSVKDPGVLVVCPGDGHEVFSVCFFPFSSFFFLFFFLGADVIELSRMLSGQRHSRCII